MKTRKKEIPFSIPFIDDREIEEVTRVLKGKWITSGPEVKKFEAAVRDYLGVNTAVAVSSGTAALNISLAVRGVGVNDDILTTAYTFASTALSVIHQGAEPIFADVEPETFNLDPASVEAFIHKEYRSTEKGLASKKTGNILRGMIPVHYGGQPAEMDALEAIAEKHGLFIVEDAAHALGARYKERKIGKSSNLACFSFYSNKNLTTGEGGMMVTDDESLEQPLRMYSLHGISKSTEERYRTGLPFYDIVYPGFKANLTDIQAALGVVQVEKLPDIDRLRNRAAQWYDEALKDIEEIIRPEIRPYNHSARHLYPILLEPGLKSRRDDIIIGLREQGIFPSVHFIPVHFHSFFKSYFKETISLPVTEDLFYREISLPLFPSLTEEDVHYVAEVLKKIIPAVKKK